jgi:hypothetical protein
MRSARRPKPSFRARDALLAENINMTRPPDPENGRRELIAVPGLPGCLLSASEAELRYGPVSYDYAYMTAQVVPSDHFGKSRRLGGSQT